MGYTINKIQDERKAEQLAEDIKRGGGRANATTAAYLIRLATRHARFMEDEYNIPNADNFDEDGNPTRRLANLRTRTKEAAAYCNCGVIFSGDPRGATVKLILPNEATNSMGGEGWCVPTRD
jgi:hypothetical protein